MMRVMLKAQKNFKTFNTKNFHACQKADSEVKAKTYNILLSVSLNRKYNENSPKSLQIDQKLNLINNYIYK